MNTLYDGANAIITKPGGVTLSEALWKRLPIFVHASLPGQEDVNKEFLLKRKLIKTLDLNTSIAVQLNSFFSDVEEQNKLKQRVDEYISQFECLAWQKIMELTIKTMLKPPKVATFSDYNNLGM